MTDRTVFHDPTGRRQRWVVRLAAIVGGVAIVVSVVFILSLIFLPVFPPTPVVPETVRRALAPGLPKLAERALRVRKFLLARVRHDLLKRIAVDEKKPARPTNAPESSIVAAFYATWQETGLHSLRANASHITHLLPVWLAMTGDGQGVDFRDWDPALTPHNLEVIGIARDHHIQVWPVFSNAEKKRFDPARAHRLLSSAAAQQRVAETLRDWLRDRHFQGINIDLENLDSLDTPTVPAFLARLKSVLAPAGLGLSFDIQATDDQLDWQKLAAPCDFVVVEGYDEHGMIDSPGPISSIDWYRTVLDKAALALPPSKIVVGLGNYAYDWPEHGGEAESMTYLEALLRARDQRPGEAPDSVVNFDPEALNPTYNYVDDDDGKEHEVWILDGVTAGNQLRLARARNMRRFALWVLGSEDPSVWSLLSGVARDTLPNLDGLKTIAFPYDVEFLGDGELLSVAEHPKTGHRELDIDEATGICTDERYHDYPTSFVLRRTGYQPHTLALTFDDGPYSPWTGMILDSLRALGVHATFFVIGQNADRQPDLVQREWDEGHEIGNHTFTHPNLGLCSIGRTRLELVATQRSVESIIGRSTRLFRPPYNADAEPTSAEEVKPIEIASDLGYLTVGEYLDPQDWALREAMPDGRVRSRTAQDIAQAVIEEVHEAHGNTILLHDGGGDRSRTAAALRLFVPRLQQEGFRFVTVSQLFNGTRAQVMPAINPHDELLIGGDRIAFNTVYGLEDILHYAFLAAIALGAARVLMIVTLALIARRRERKIDPNLPPATSVSVLIAAYNERAVIGRTVHAVLASEPPPLEVIVVDDGSTDGTSEALRESVGDDPRVRLIRQTNQGKAAALNHALAMARGDFVVCLDADTLFVHDTIAWLTRHFVDGRVAAVAGNVKVGNRVNLLTYWQAIEYVSSQNLDRRAYAFMNAVTVVPGACGAWRRTTMQAVGGLSSDTLAEDMDLTWRLRRAGWRIENEPHAVAYTEAPETLNALFRQRFRWAFGTLQCLWKHRAALGRLGAFGMLMMPSLWLFQILFPVLSPIVDVQITITLVQFGQTWLAQSILTRDWQPMPAALAMLNHVAFMYAFFLLIEFFGAAIAFWLDRERKRLLWWVVWQRFVYRQIMYAVVLRSVQTAIGGLRAGWGKVERRGTATSAAHRR